MSDSARQPERFERREHPSRAILLTSQNGLGVVQFPSIRPPVVLLWSSRGLPLICDDMYLEMIGAPTPNEGFNLNSSSSSNLNLNLLRILVWERTTGEIIARCTSQASPSIQFPSARPPVVLLWSSRGLPLICDDMIWK